MADMKAYVEDVLEIIKKKDWNQPEFMNTAKEVLYSIIPVLEGHPEYKKNKLLERFIEPERTVIFRVPVFFLDDFQYIFYISFHVCHLNSLLLCLPPAFRRFFFYTFRRYIV